MSPAPKRRRTPDHGNSDHADVHVGVSQRAVGRYSDDPEFAAKVVLSRLMCRSDPRSVGDIDQAFRVLLAYGATGLPGHPPLWARKPATSRGVASALRRIGLNRPRLVNEYWRAAENLDRDHAALPDWILEAVVWPEARQALVSLIEDGPRTAAKRLNWVLRDLAASQAPPKRSRPAGAKMAANTIAVAATAARLLPDLVHKIACDGVCPQTLVGWTGGVPTIKRPRGEPADTNRAGPSLEGVRRAMRSLERSLAHALSLRPNETEREALTRIPATALRMRGAWRVARSRALLALIVCVAPRVDAVARLRRCDVLSEHRSPDGRVGPAIALPPSKYVRQVRFKPIPFELFELIAVFDELTHRICAAEGRDVADDGALFPGFLTRPNKAPWSSSLTRMLTGESVRGQSKTQGLLPRPGSPRGHSAQSLRHTNARGIQAAVALLPPGVPDVHALPVLERILQDQKANKLPYLDVNHPWEIERLSGLATRLMWEMVFTDKGARKTRNVDAYRLALAVRSQLRAERRTLIKTRAGAATGPEQVAIDDLDDALRRNEARLAYLRDDEAALIPIDDDRPDADAVFDLRAVEEELQADLILLGPLLRRWITITELCELCEISRRQLGRWWVSGRPLGTRDERQPFGAGPVRLDVSCGHRRRRVLVEDLDPKFLADRSRAAQLQYLLRTWPDGWSEEACQAPLTSRPLSREELDLTP